MVSINQISKPDSAKKTDFVSIERRVNIFEYLNETSCSMVL